ncbi:PEP-CTERM protein-sorting domain-containing protein [Nitrosospira sp. Nsp18]|uniref:PEP-CTERM sorting domain-containing protein n=1 Tax=Nitrosospira sp. Nsp18 TaxID=1855334 RepID=UPI000887672C|nr:PEP-CTERM sorting domain-containing protein [Nitrosospira sp. Nsp18]SDA20964.1 PEP-CTERM protein-sorting domain-containing protein [Nitrosospira sp. Nsp18]
MNKTKHFLAVIGCSIGAVVSQPSFAADRTSDVTVDWSQLQISVTGVDGTVPGVTFSDQNTSLSSSAQVPQQGSEYNSKSIYDWTSSAAVTADATSTTFAHTTGSATNLSANAQSVGGGSYDYWNNPGASSSGNRSESFSFDGPGVLTVTVPYTLNISGGDPYNYYDSVSASVNANASFYGYGDNGSFNSDSHASFALSSYYDSSPQSRSGNLVFGIFAAGPGSGTLSIDLGASTSGFVSSIPEPQSYAMLLAGLGLMGAVAQRRGINKSAQIFPAA